jgi:hypothetical protein
MRKGLPCVAGGKDNLWLQLHTLYSQFGLLCQVHPRTVPVPLHIMYRHICCILLKISMYLPHHIVK